MTCTDTKVDINKKRWMWTSGVTCLIAEGTGEGGEKVKKTLESYLYKLQGQGFCHYLPTNLLLKYVYFSPSGFYPSPLGKEVWGPQQLLDIFICWLMFRNCY